MSLSCLKWSMSSMSSASGCAWRSAKRISAPSRSHEVAAVEGARQAVAQRRLEQLPLRRLLDGVVARELEHRGLADADLLPSLSTRSETRSPSTKVPFCEPRSASSAPSATGVTRAWRRETPSSSARRRLRVAVAADDDLALDGEDLAEVRRRRSPPGRGAWAPARRRCRRISGVALVSSVKPRGGRSRHR